MPHPIMFDETDPLLARVRALVLAYPGAQEKISHGRPFFFTKTSFAVYGGSDKDTRASFPRSLIIKPDATNASPSSVRITRICMYLGPSGWVGYDLDRDAVDWAEVAELVDMSFRETAPVKLVRELDARLG